MLLLQTPLGPNRKGARHSALQAIQKGGREGGNEGAHLANQGGAAPTPMKQYESWPLVGEKRVKGLSV